MEIAVIFITYIYHDGVFRGINFFNAITNLYLSLNGIAEKLTRG